MSEFIAISLTRIPETRGLSSARLQSMLNRTFRELREKGSLGKLWDWGTFLYTTYGWATTVINLYHEPKFAFLVLRTIWSAVKWAVGDMQ